MSLKDVFVRRAMLKQLKRHMTDVKLGPVKRARDKRSGTMADWFEADFTARSKSGTRALEGHIAHAPGISARHVEYHDQGSQPARPSRESEPGPPPEAPQPGKKRPGKIDFGFKL
jgi:hypothetical protein